MGPRDAVSRTAPTLRVPEGDRRRPTEPPNGDAMHFGLRDGVERRRASCVEDVRADRQDHR